MLIFSEIYRCCLILARIGHLFALIVYVRTLINKCKTIKGTKMNHTILTDTEFFNHINSSEYKELPSAYNEFIARVIEHCHSAADIKHIAVALMYAEIELQFQQVQDDSEMSVYIQKALAFVKRCNDTFQQLLPKSHH